MRTVLVSTVASLSISLQVAANDAQLGDAQVGADVPKTVVEGDIFVNDAPSVRSVAVPDASQLWPDGVIPYVIDASLPSSNAQSLATAVAHWNTVSAITFRQVSEGEISTQGIQDYVRVIPGNFCASWVGKRGGEQELWVAANCGSGSLMHELGHVIGLEHEHTRFDRNDYITIHWDNIQPDRIHNFDAAPTGSRLLGSYDYDSIMHYGPNNFSSNGQPTITIKDGSNRNIGQRIAPSVGDLSSVGMLYGADLSVVALTYPKFDVTEVDVFVTNEVTQGAHDITLTITTSDGEPLQIDESGLWDCSSQVGMTLLCSLDRLPAGGSEAIRLSGASQGGDVNVRAQVASKTPDSDLSNNSSRTDGVSEPVTPPAQSPLMPEPVPVLISDDSILPGPVAHVSTGGAINWGWMMLCLLALYRQAGLRIDKRNV